MSDTLATPTKPASTKPKEAKDWTDSEWAEWSAEIFRVRGWKSNTAKHQALKKDLDRYADTLFTKDGPGSAAKLTADKLDTGAQFKAYLKSLAAYEKKPGPKTAAQLKTDAENVCNSAAQPEEGETSPPRAACQKTLADLDRLQKVKGLGDPPWKSDQAMLAATIKAEADFASLPLGNQKAERLGGNMGVNPSFWIKKAGKDPADPDTSYLFKPTTSKQDRLAIPKGGEPAREALTGRTADILNGMTGIDFKVPETHIIKVGREHFDGVNVNQVAGASRKDKQGNAVPLVGSLQQFAPSNGELRKNSPSMARAVPDERCQELALLDIVTLHLDRHSGNFMINGNDEKADLVPIDNGLTFPESPSEVSVMSTSHNALLRLPGSHQKFTPKMLRKITQIEPDALKAALKKEVGDIGEVHGAAGKTIADPALEQSRRAAMFLKIAAPSLTPALVQIALGRNAVELFDPDLQDREFTRKAQAIIKSIAAKQDELAECFQMSMDEQIAVEKACEALGWKVSDLLPEQRLKIVKTGARCPNAAAPQIDPADLTEQEINDIKSLFPKVEKVNKQMLNAWRELAAIHVTKDDIEKAALTEYQIGDNVRSEPSDLLLKKIRAMRAVDAVPGVTAQAGSRTMLDFKYDVLKKIAAVLHPTLRGSVLKKIDALHADGDADGMAVYRDEVAGMVRRRLIILAEAGLEAAKRQDIPGAINKFTNMAKMIGTDSDYVRAQELFGEGKDLLADNTLLIGI